MQNSELEMHSTSEVQRSEFSSSTSSPAVAAIFLAEPTAQRLVEGLCVQLELIPVIMDPAQLEAGLLGQCELIVADSNVARSIKQLLKGREENSDGINPAVVAVQYRPAITPEAPPPIFVAREDPAFESTLTLPQDPSQVLAQLSVILYAHRAYARRFQSALEELQLNRRIFRSVTSGISVADVTRPDLPLVYVNPAFEVMTGYSLEEVLGKNCRFLQNDDHDQPGLTLIREAIRARREVTAILRNYRKNGTLFWNELSLSPICNREGTVTHFVGIQTDVTARVEFEAALRESEKLAAVGRLAASIAHEINNPLESVTNLLYLARHSSDMPEICNYLDQADRELQRASQITNQSLRFYRQSTKPQAVRPADLLGAVLDLYESKLKNACVHVELRQRMTESVVCLESEIRQVLNNLLRNAVDAMKGHSGRLLIRSRESTEHRSGAKGVLITFADTGSGISPDTMKNLYTAFFTTKGTSGTGLGLWVSSEIIRRHKGHIVVRSSVRPGCSWTVFELFLPYQPFAS